MYVTKINEIRGYEFEREPETVHSKVWREEREGGNDVIINLKI